MSSTASNAGGLVGQRLGKYEIVALLALGGTAEIYLARIAGVAGFEKYVVVKCLHDHLADDSEFVRMFLDEARLGAQLTHTNIVQTLELGEQQGRYFMVMDYLAGMSMAVIARKAAEHIPGGMLPVDLLLALIAQACAGLHYAHTRTDASGEPLKVVHRDVSPQNLVVTFEGLLKVVDFGIAKAAVRETQTQSGTIKGKFAYMSPEQCHGTNVDHRTDVFALGIVLHEFLTGRRLFRRENAYDTYHAILECKVPPPSQLNPDLDPALDAIVLKALTHDADQRYQSAEEFGEALASVLHRRGKSVGAGEVAEFFDRHFGAEIREHGERMRALLSGRMSSTMDEFWEDMGDGSMPEEVSAQHDRASSAGMMAMDHQAEPSEVSAVEEVEGGATRIEYNPLERAQKLHDELSTGRRAALAAGHEQAPGQTSAGGAGHGVDEDGLLQTISDEGEMGAELRRQVQAQMQAQMQAQAPSPPAWAQPDTGDGNQGWHMRHGTDGMMRPMLVEQPRMLAAAPRTLLSRWQGPEGSYPRWFLGAIFGACVVIGLSVTLLIGALL